MICREVNWKITSPPYVPELHAIAEKIDRTITEAACALVYQAALFSCLWHSALKHALYVRNWIQHSTAICETALSIMLNVRPAVRN